MPRRLALLLALTLGCAARQQRPTVAGMLRFQCTPPDAHVVYDEEDLGPCVVWQSRWLGLTPGTHRLRIERTGYFPQESEVRGDGRRQTVTVSLRAIPD